MGQKLETNILIIGKSGVGKSSLLNYLFGSQKAKTGSGRPVTEKGDFQTEQLELENDLVVNITDTWGLEANKANEWKSLIINEVKKHDDSGSISEWFHTILYCLSAKSARVEDFEKEIIRELIDNGNEVTVILTHSDANNIEDAITEMTKTLKEAGIEENNIVRVCSISKKLLGGRETKTFGKEEILKRVRDNLWHNICNKMNTLLKSIVNQNLDNWYYIISSSIDLNVKWYNCHSDKKLKELNDFARMMLDAELESIKNEVNDQVEQAYNYYSKLSEKLYLIEKGTDNINFKFDIDRLTSMCFEDKLAENLAALIVNVLPLGIIFARKVFAEEKRNSLKNELDSIKERLSIDISSEIEKIVYKLMSFNLE